MRVTEAGCIYTTLQTGPRKESLIVPPSGHFQRYPTTDWLLRIKQLRLCIDILNDTTVQVTSLHAMLLWMGRPSEYAIFDYMPMLSMSNNGVV